RRRVGALERIRAEVVELRHPQRDERLRPQLERPLRPLLHEDELPVVEAQRDEVAVVAEVDEALWRAPILLAREVRDQVVSADGHGRRLEPWLCPLTVLPADSWPSLSFSTTSGSPAAARNVGSQSWCCTI